MNKEREGEKRKRNESETNDEEQIPKKKNPPQMELPAAAKHPKNSDGREDIAALPFPAKLDAILDVLESEERKKKENKGEKMAATMKTFLSRTARPIQRCLTTHHGGDKQSWLRA